MKTSLYLQIIHTSWTKQSRGGALATPRNAIPLTFPLEDIHDGYLSVQHVSYGENDPLQIPHTTRKKIELTKDLRYEHGSFVLRWDGQAATTQVQDRYGAMGAPGIKSLDAQMGRFIVAANEWARLRWQGRFSDCDYGWWSYKHTCINIGHFTPPLNPHIFLQTEPTKYFTHLPHLW